MKGHLKPKPLVIAERFKFHCRNQGESESVAQYMVELRKLADKCHFEGYLEEALRDRLVCGLRNEAIQRRLLTIDGLNLDNAYKTAHGMETAQQHASQLQASSNTVNFLKKKKPFTKPPRSNQPSGSASCYRCGKTNHTPEACYYKRQQCRACNQFGHIAKMCKQPRTERTHLVEEPEVMSNTEPTDELPLMNIQLVKPESSPAGLMVTVTVDGKPLQMELPQCH